MVLLYPGSDLFTINAQLKKIYAENEQETNLKTHNKGILQPLSAIHFNTELDGSVSLASLRNLGILALLLLFLAVINFINLSTSMSTLRSKEVGVRKTFGGNNRQIIYQFLTETFLLTFFATVLAVFLTPLLIHIFSGFMPVGLDAQMLLKPVTVAFLFINLILVSLFAGIYPAFVLTKFKPALVLKSTVSKNGRSKTAVLRQALTVSQFVVAQVFLIAVLIISKQLYFVLHHDLGFKKEAIVSFTVPDFQLRNESKKFLLTSELEYIPAIRNYTICSSPPIRNGWMETGFRWVRDGVEDAYNNTHVRTVDANYLNVFGLQLLAGRNLHVDTTASVTDVLINESLLHKMGYMQPKDAIGQLVKGGPADSGRVVGVLKDFSTMSLHAEIPPTAVFADNKSRGMFVSLALNPRSTGNWANALTKTSKLFKGLYPHYDIELNFLDKKIEDLYASDLRLSTLLKWATGLAIFISCLGLLGLVSFMTHQRVKEIGIRKILGATVSQIIILLSKSLVRLVLLASVISIPIAWYFSRTWLQSFAFKTVMSWWVYGISALGMLIMALTILWMKTLSAAKANPAHSLKAD